MNEDTVKIELTLTENGFQIPSDINLADFGINDGEKCLFTIDEKTGEGKIQKVCDALMEEIEQFDDKLMEIIFEQSSKITSQLGCSAIPKSGFTLISLLVSINSLKLGIFELCKSRDIYSISVLYRSFLEHFIKINYFFYRLLEDKTDLVGEDFQKFYSKNEMAMYGKSIVQLRQLVDLEYNGKDITEILYEIDPELKKYSPKELKMKTLQFNYKSMVKYIFDKQNNFQKDINSNIILSIIPEYSDLSSFVHGGPYAINNTSKIWNNNEVEFRCSQFARSTFNIYVISNLLLSLLYTSLVDKSYMQFHNSINEVWKEANVKIEEYFKNTK